ncbi:MAG: maleylpyruvate isomerase family mycothiol-dependent enzyme, partial [Rhodococcus sp. (in: high G+C Gram-positive bacteria)]|uniref:maleylpyruvate isomerase family mycothiol-dependent enzyme n=2 Tax=unclassified Rhodococcus (in: high G+C Gram-positive bacteria) TaxID=192944 RepID=UPI002AD8032A|nr:maleylpyruvate isomerase family mycothiol-dependent enzyme [Rhodococcus sp. (in: high G+C Gram-positive bacteria)]
MDVNALHTATEILAEYLSEVTHGDLGQATPANSWDIGDLYIHLIEENISIARGLADEPVHKKVSKADKVTRSDLEAAAHLYGGGYEERYRRTSRALENAFAAVADRESLHSIDGITRTAHAWYDRQVNNTVIHTWDMTQAMGFTYHPSPDVALRVLRTESDLSIDDVTAIWEAALRLSGRLPAVQQVQAVRTA